MSRYIKTYLGSYQGLSKPTWMLAAIMLINRIGAMVLPFLGIYMTTSLGFSLKEAGIVLSFFGVGAVLGSVIGGWLTDQYGHFKVQVGSLFFAVPVFVVLPFLESVFSLSAGIFTLSLITEIFRPANSVSISAYAKPENITRAFSLNRMALNLGFSIGPALGGFFAAISYHLLFYGNAFSVAIAGIIFYWYFKKREENSAKELKNAGYAVPGNKKNKAGISPWKDQKFIIFSILCCLYSICFFQLLSTLPLYYKDIYQLNDWNIGLLLGFNGLVVFLLEMILVSTAEKKMKITSIIVFGTILCGSSFLVLLLSKSLFVLYFAMFILSVSEILAMPFMATVAINRAHKARQGAYMGMNALAFSASHILAPYLGTAIAQSYSFETLWWIIAGISMVTALGFWWNMKGFAGGVKREK